MSRAVQDIGPDAGGGLVMSEELQAVIRRMGEQFLPPGTQPTPAPAAGQSTAEWASRVAVARSHHDAAALFAAQLHAHHRPDNPSQPEVGSITDLMIDVPDGVLGARVYRPQGAGPFGALLLLHGGAFWMGGGATGFALNHDYCLRVCAEAGVVVLNLDYRLAPEHPFPASLEDSAAGLRWLHEHAAELEIDADRIVVHGISSGGNLAAALAQQLERHRLPPLCGQVLQAPAVNLDLASTAFASGDIPGVDEQMIAGALQIVQFYARGRDPQDPGISPALRDDLTGVAPTFLVVATFDALRADAERYAARLTQAGVDCEVVEYPMTHTDAVPEVFEQMQIDMVAAVRRFVDGSTR